MNNLTAGTIAEESTELGSISPSIWFSFYSNRLWHFAKAVLGIIFHHPVTGVNIVPILTDGRIVLARRRDTGCWALPGGMVQWGEDITTTVQRELAEETGLELVGIRRLVGIYSTPERDPRIHSICIVVEAEVQGRILVQDTQEISEVQAFYPNALPKDQISYDNGQQLMHCLDGLIMLA